MVKVNIGSQTSPFRANEASTDYILGYGDAIINGTDGIDATEALAGRTFTINGDISSVDVGFDFGLSGTPSPSTTVTIGEKGRIMSGNVGINNFSSGSTFTNHGVITGQDGFVSTGNDNRIINAGNIFSSDDGIALNGADNRVVNTGMIHGVDGIYVTSADDALNTIINSGTLSGDDRAIRGGLGDETVVNSGKIYGDIYMSDGEDTFISKGGFVTGYVTGAAGNDTYVIGKGSVELKEYSGGGIDSVKSSATYALESEFEYLTLTGKGNANGLGNELGNMVIGNSGKNSLFGFAGMDSLMGGAGRDVLTGGLGADEFYFMKNADVEIISDFVDGEDRLFFFADGNVKTIGNLLKHHVEDVGKDLLIDANGTEMLIKNMDSSDLTIADFAV